MSQINHISECFIRPVFEPDVSKRQYPLGALHLRMLPMNYMHTGYLYKKPYNYSSSSYIAKLKLTLSQALVHFYPLAGRLETQRFEDEHSSYIYVDCSKGPGERLIHAAASNVTVYDIVSSNSDVPTVVQYLFDLGERGVNCDGNTRPLLSVQVTELADGVFFGFTANHCVVDGTLFTHFYKAWSDIFMGLTASASSFPRPIFRKPDFLDRYDGRVIKLPYLDQNEFILRSDTEVQLRERYFHFSKTCMRNLKVKANTEAAANSSSTVDISSFKALTASVWRCITRARVSPSHEVTFCALPVNLRPRLNPPLSQDYFGNYFMRVNGCAKVGELLENNLGWAAMLLHEAVSSFDDKVAASAVFARAYNKGPELLLPCLRSHSNHVVMAGSPWFDLLAPEFGFGSAVCSRGGYGNKQDGKVNSLPGSSGDRGSVDLEICLAPDTMSALLLDKEFISFAGVNLASRI